MQSEIASPPAEAYQILRPQRQTLPLVFASPHSGRDYPGDFVAGSALDPVLLRRSEDSFVDQIFGAAPALGAPLLRALFPRAFVDPNREPYELDPAMFEDALPSFVNTRSPRVQAGLGTIARVVANGAEIYGAKLRYAEAKDRIELFYKPYHLALERLIDETRAQFGFCILIDCHSMPSVGGPTDHDAGQARVDFVLGDCFGASCMPRLTEAAERALIGLGYVVTRNNPYAGGFTTRHYGRPGAGVHALQIEINRALYMVEETIEPNEYLSALSSHASQLIEALGAFALAEPGLA
jgi:N-formylglutamate amidohydrolase